MRIGVMIEGQEGLTWERWFRIAGRVEELGLDSLWRSDHFFSVMARTERPSLEAWTSLTALAERTRRIRFGPLVSPMTFRHPALLARMAAAVDLLSGGRLVLGLGAGWNEEEHAAFGIPLPPLGERMDRLEEGIGVIRALWSGGPATLDGRYYALRQATLLPRPAQSPGPPILIGGDGEFRLLRIVARHADEWNSHARDIEAYRAKRAKLEEHCRAVGRDPDLIARSLMTGVLIAPDPAGVAERGRWLHAFLPSAASMPVERVPDQMRERGWLVGTPEAVAEQVRVWERAGVQRLMLQYFDLDDVDGLALLAEVARSVE
jgi:F420-dependent oxidoreductase-like protein